MVQCCADSLECSPLLCFLKGHLHIFFMSYTLICFCSQKFRRPLPCSSSCCVLRCFCIVLFKFQWYKCESCICESDPVLDFAVFPLFTTLACCYCVSFLVATWGSWAECLTTVNTQKLNGLAFLSDLQLCFLREWPMRLKLFCLAIIHSELKIKYSSLFFLSSIIYFIYSFIYLFACLLFYSLWFLCNSVLTEKPDW